MWSPFFKVTELDTLWGHKTNPLRFHGHLEEEGPCSQLLNALASCLSRSKASFTREPNTHPARGFSGPGLGPWLTEPTEVLSRGLKGKALLTNPREVRQRARVALGGGEQDWFKHSGHDNHWRKHIKIHSFFSLEARVTQKKHGKHVNYVSSKHRCPGCEHGSFARSVVPSLWFETLGCNVFFGRKHGHRYNVDYLRIRTPNSDGNMQKHCKQTLICGWFLVKSTERVHRHCVISVFTTMACQFSNFKVERNVAQINLVRTFASSGQHCWITNIWIMQEWR